MIQSSGPGFPPAATTGLVNNATGIDAVVEERNELMRQARFAMQRMTSKVAETNYLFLPQPDKPDTNWRENVREETPSRLWT